VLTTGAGGGGEVIKVLVTMGIVCKTRLTTAVVCVLVNVVVKLLVLVPVRVRVPCWVSMPLMATATVKASLRLTTRLALLTTLAEATLPLVPPLPSCKVPAEMVVVPV
jgi:hypothetical protein